MEKEILKEKDEEVVETSAGVIKFNKRFFAVNAGIGTVVAGYGIVGLVIAGLATVPAVVAGIGAVTAITNLVFYNQEKEHEEEKQVSVAPVKNLKK